MMKDERGYVTRFGLKLKGQRQPQVFAGVLSIGAIFCNIENGADRLHADIATAPTSYRRAIAVDRSFFTKRSIPSLSLNAHKFAVVLHLLKCYLEKKNTLFLSIQEKVNVENVVEGMSGLPAFIAVLSRRTLKPLYEVCSDDNAMKTFNLNVLESHYN